MVTVQSTNEKRQYTITTISSRIVDTSKQCIISHCTTYCVLQCMDDGMLTSVVYT